MSSVFDNADTQEPESDTGPRRTDDLIREIYADVKVLKHSIGPIREALQHHGEALANHDVQITAFKLKDAKVKGFIAAAGAFGGMGFWAWIESKLKGQ